jgi:hypothetical protein
MEVMKLRAVRGIGMEQIFSEPPEKKREVLFTIRGMGEVIPALSESFTLVLNRDIQSCVEMASELAVYIAKKYPEQNVMLINTYAGMDLMQKTMALGMYHSQLQMPPAFKRFFTRMDDSWFSETASPGMRNVHVLDCPISTCTPWRLEAELGIVPAQILILNSFEFGALSHWHRSVLAEGLLALQQKFGLSVVIFSQEMRSDVRPMSRARGPIGMLSAISPAVWKVQSVYDNMGLGPNGNMRPLNHKHIYSES